MRGLLLIALVVCGNVGSAAALAISDPVPDVTVTDAAGRPVPLASLRRPDVPFVVLFWGPGCPCSAACDDALEALVRPGPGPRPAVAVLDPASLPEERALVVADRKARHLTIPLHFDHALAAARAFLARTTPTAYVFDRTGRLAYQGAFERLADAQGVPLEPSGGVVLRPVDPARPAPPPQTFSFVDEAVRRLLEGQRPRLRWVQPAGCPIVHDAPLPPPSATERTLFSK